MKNIIKKLNPNVIKIMKLIAEHGFITNEEIEMFLNVKRRCVYKYIGFLKYIDVVDEIVTPFYGMKAFCLNRQGYDLLDELNELRVKDRYYKKDFNLTYFNHIRTNLQVRYVFETHPWVLDYRPERVIDYYADLRGDLVEQYRRSQMKHMDAEIIAKTAEGDRLKIGVEIELVRKTLERYRRAILNISSNRKDLNYVCWICGDDEIFKTILEAIKIIRSCGISGLGKHCLTIWDKFKQIKFDDFVWVDAWGSKGSGALPLIKHIKYWATQQVKTQQTAVPQQPEIKKPEPESEPEPEEQKIEPDQRPKFRSYRPFIPPPPEPKEPRLR